MTNVGGITWRFLVIEDDDETVRQLEEAIPGFVDAPDSTHVESCKRFDDGAERLANERYDFLILDLKDDSKSAASGEEAPEEASPGVKIFESLKKTRFVPVVFYTALAHVVRAQETSFVRVVEKTEGLDKLKQEVRRVLETRLPSLTREIEEAERSYMWDFITSHWKEFERTSDKADLAYLLARRLAITLERLATRLAQTADDKGSEPTVKAHPMMMYIVPPIAAHCLAGDVLLQTVGGVFQYWIVLTPSCDFFQEKVAHVVLAKCENLTEQREFKNWSLNPADPSKAAKANMENLIGDNRERYKFLPGTFFLPDLVVDFQQLRSVPVKALEEFTPVASLDSPFGEAILARFARYFGRVGTPDLDKDLVLKRIEAMLTTSSK